MSFFDKEKDMQDWASGLLDQNDGLIEVITNAETAADDPIGDYYSSRISASIKKSLESLQLHDVVFENENISITQKESLKPDFVLYAPETESIVVVELKNIKGPSREAGTELGAYTSEIRSAIPFISDGDIVHVIVSPVWPTLLLHYIRHQIIWQQKNVICLEPVKDGTDEIVLKALTVSDIYEDTTGIRISENHLGAYQLCFYDYSVANNAESEQHHLLDHFNTALRVMAITGDRMNSHGFAFLWRDSLSTSVAPYSITVANFAPFQSLERFLHLKDAELPEIIERYMRVVQENGPTGHSSKTMWEIIDSGKALLDMVCMPTVEGYHPWKKHKRMMNRGLGRADYISFVGWGLFGEMQLKKLKESYNQGEINIAITDPHMGWSVIDELIDENYEHIDLTHLEWDHEDTKSEE